MAAFIGLKGPTFFLVFLISFIVAVLIGQWIKWWRLRGEGDLDRVLAGMSPYEIAILRDGPRGAFMTALMRLALQGKIEADGTSIKGLASDADSEDREDPVCDELLKGLQGGKTLSLTMLSSRVEGQVTAMTDGMPPGLLLSKSASSTTRLLTALPALVVVCMGVIKLFRGLSLGRPVVFLIAALAVSGFVVGRLFLTKFSRVTRHAKTAFAIIENRYAALETTAKRNVDMLEIDDATLAFALWGDDALSGRIEWLVVPFEEFESRETQATLRQAGSYAGFYAYDCATPIVMVSSCASSSSCSSVSSCSSCSSCGGGCGGCGGCA